MADDKFNRYCEQLLVHYTRRNTKAVTRHLKSVCDILRHEDDHVVQTKFGGSVQKGTYVTGLNDVDVLLIVNDPHVKAIQYFVDHDDSVDYRDTTPLVRGDDLLRIRADKGEVGFESKNHYAPEEEAREAAE